MKKLLLFLLAISLLATMADLHAQGTAFTYQGRLNSGGSPANGNYDLTFALFNNASTNIGQVGATQTNMALGITNGLFTVALDFGADFSGATRWLAISVRTNGGAGFTPLNPLQELAPSPYAIFATTASNLSGTLPVAQLSAGTAAINITGNAATATTAANVTGNIADIQLSANIARLNGTNTFTGSNNFAGVAVATNANNILKGAFTGNGGGLTNLNATNLTGVVSLSNGGLGAGITNLVANATYTNGTGPFAGYYTYQVTLQTNTPYVVVIDPTEYGLYTPDAGLEIGYVGQNNNVFVTNGTYYFMSPDPGKVLSLIYASQSIVFPVRVNAASVETYGAAWGSMLVANNYLSSPVEMAVGNGLRIDPNHGDSIGGDGSEWEFVLNQAAFVFPAFGHMQFGGQASEYRHQQFYFNVSYNENSTSNGMSHMIGWDDYWTNVAGAQGAFWNMFCSNYDSVNGNALLTLYAPPITNGLHAATTATGGPLISFDTFSNVTTMYGGYGSHNPVHGIWTATGITNTNSFSIGGLATFSASSFTNINNAGIAVGTNVSLTGTTWIEVQPGGKINATGGMSGWWRGL